MNGFGSRLRSLRLERGLTPEKMAEEINFTKSVIWSYELDKKEPSISHIKRISDYFNVSIDYLLNGVDNNQSTLILELDNQKIMEQHDLLVNGMELNQDELIDVVAFIKAKRLLKEK